MRAASLRARRLRNDRFTIDGRTYSIRATVIQALQGELDSGGTVGATEGNDVDLAPGTVLRVRLDAPLDVAQSAGSVAGFPLITIVRPPAWLHARP